MTRLATLTKKSPLRYALAKEGENVRALEREIERLEAKLDAARTTHRADVAEWKAISEHWKRQYLTLKASQEGGAPEGG